MEGDQKRVVKFKICEPKVFKNSSHIVEVFGAMQSLRKDEGFCDVKLETDDGTVVHGHKVVLVSANPYFRAMFSSFEESNKDHVNMKELDSTVLQLLINYIYTGEITVNEEHVQGLLAAANLIQLDYIKSACVEFLQTQLNPSNCIGIRALADLHNCIELMSSSEAYIKKQFLEVVKYDEFLSLSSEEVILLISRSDLAVTFEENVFESVINWVKHELGCRQQFLPELMEHVRLPLTSKPYLLKNVFDEPLLKNSPKCIDYVLEAIHFHLLKEQDIIIIPRTIRCKPRQPGGLQKVILMASATIHYKGFMNDKSYTNWFDPASNIFHTALEMNQQCHPTHLALIADQFVIAIDDICSQISHYDSVQVLDLSSQTSCWVPINNMLVNRSNIGVGVLNDCLYAVGGFCERHFGSLNSVEVLDASLQWRMVSNMCIERNSVGVGALNNLLYVIGGFDSSKEKCLKSVECYDPSLDTWKLVAEMSIGRSFVGIGILDGVIYAVGGYSDSGYCKSVEAYRPSVGVWTPVADMHHEHYRGLVVALDGLLYVLGDTNYSTDMLTVQIYNPNTNTWKLMETHLNGAGRINAAVVIDRPLHFKTG